MNNQEVFDKVWDYFMVKKHRQAFAAKGTLQSNPNFVGCLYRSPDGNKCAVGCLFPDDLYDPEMEGNGASEIVQRYPEVAAIFEGSDPEFLDEIQYAHDESNTGRWFWRTFKDNLKRVAGQFDLVVPQ